MTTRLIVKAGIALTFACLSATVAAASGWAPPGVAGSFDGRSPDTVDAGLAAHRGSRVLSAARVVPVRRPLNGIGYDGRSPDTTDAAVAAYSNGRVTHDARAGRVSPTPNGSGYDGRSPDTKDAALAAHSTAATVVIAAAGGFDWTDAGIGAAAGFGLAVMLGAGLTLTRKETTAAAS